VAAEEVTHAEVLEVGRRKAGCMCTLVEGIVGVRAVERVEGWFPGLGRCESQLPVRIYSL
jgi:hypothetical protein